MDPVVAWRPLLTPIANAYHLDPLLVQGIVWVESRGRSDAFRHEPQFWLRYLAKLPDYKGQMPRRVASSYGLMQIMYPRAKEGGFQDEPEMLFLPRANLHVGCKILRGLLDWADQYQSVSPADRLTAAVAAYNGGKGGNTPGTALRPANLQYTVRVQAAINQLREM